jgi:Flp pilus assembly protein TadD
MMEHWLYLPLLGLTMAFTACLHLLAQRMKEPRGAAFALALVVILLSVRTAARNSAWGNPILLFLQDAQLYPKQEKNWFLLAYAYAERGRADQAIRAYQIGLTLNSNHAYGWSGLGEAYSMAGRDEEAERSFLKATSIVPENPWLHYVLGITRLKAGKIDLAIESLNRAVSLTPPLPMAYHVLGSAYLRQGKKDEADAAFRKALAMLPRESEIHVATHVELGKLYMKRGDKTTAIEEWRLALQFDPNDREAKALLERETKETPVRSP